MSVAVLSIYRYRKIGVHVIFSYGCSFTNTLQRQWRNPDQCLLYKYLTESRLIYAYDLRFLLDRLRLTHRCEKRQPHYAEAKEGIYLVSLPYR